jgi:HSP20 family protein
MSTSFGLAPIRKREVTLPDPFLTLQQRLNKILAEPFAPFGFPVEEGLLVRGWVPTCDVFETPTQMIIKLELPEVKKENIHVLIEGNMLTISGERKLEENIKEENYHRIERNYGEFVRTFTLPPTLELKTLTAEFNEGLLRVVIQKREEARAKAVEVKVK